MRARASIGRRILLPIFILVAILTVALLFLIHRISGQVREDYHNFTVTASTSHVSTILELAVAELTMARLVDNPVVTAAKKDTVREAIALFWLRSGLEGLIAAADGTIVVSTLDQTKTRDILALRRTGYFSLPGAAGGLHCFAKDFPLWGWSVISVARHSSAPVVRRELVLLLPLLAVGSLVLASGLFLVLWRNLRRPVAQMIAAVAAQRAIPPTGIAEFDGIGTAVNEALARVRERTAELSSELAHRLRAEVALRESEENIRHLLNSTAEGIFGVDTKGVCTFCNPAALRLLGYDREEELLDRQVHPLIHHSHQDGTAFPAAECFLYRAYSQRQEVHANDEVFWRRDGSSFPVEVWSHPVVAAGVVTGAVVTFFDISEKAGLEQQLRQAQKMEAVGRLAGGIAHDFNNMLMAIIGFAEMSREIAEEGSKLRFYNEQILAAADKATNLTRQILAFSRKQVLSLLPVDVNEIILGLGKIVTRLLGEDIEVSLKLDGSKIVVLADRAQIEQVLLNLCTNARDAMPAGGHLVIGTRAIACDAEGAQAHGLESIGRYAMITVSDSGAGMDEQTRQWIFEPFFTTKEPGKGTGLGLSIVYGIVKQHHGQVNVYSEPGRGTTFRIYFPLTQEAVAEQPAAAPAPVRGGTETVLLGEDNEEVRTLARTVLEQAGYRVLVAKDGLEALNLFTAHRDAIRLCLFDLVMPQLSGKEVLARIRERRPEMRAIFMSGYAGEILGDPRNMGTGVVFLSKPLLPRELLRLVREALDA